MFGLFGNQGLFGGGGLGYRQQQRQPSHAESGGYLDGRAMDYSWLEKYGNGEMPWGSGLMSGGPSVASAQNAKNNPVGELLERLRSGNVPDHLAYALNDPKSGARLLGLPYIGGGSPFGMNAKGFGLKGVMRQLKSWDASKLESDPAPPRPQWSPPDPSLATSFGDYSLPENTQANPLAYLG